MLDWLWGVLGESHIPCTNSKALSEFGHHTVRDAAYLGGSTNFQQILAGSKKFRSNVTIWQLFKSFRQERREIHF